MKVVIKNNCHKNATSLSRNTKVLAIEFVALFLDQHLVWIESDLKLNLVAQPFLNNVIKFLRLNKISDAEKNIACPFSWFNQDSLKYVDLSVELKNYQTMSWNSNTWQETLSWNWRSKLNNSIATCRFSLWEILQLVSNWFKKCPKWFYDISGMETFFSSNKKWISIMVGSFEWLKFYSLFDLK